MRRRQTIETVLNLAAGVVLLILAAHFIQRDDLAMALLTTVAGVAALLLAVQDFARLRRS